MQHSVSNSVDKRWNPIYDLIMMNFIQNLNYCSESVWYFRLYLDAATHYNVMEIQPSVGQIERLSKVFCCQTTNNTFIGASYIYSDFRSWIRMASAPEFFSYQYYNWRYTCIDFISIDFYNESNQIQRLQF